jgi:hypothetical protein
MAKVGVNKTLEVLFSEAVAAGYLESFGRVFGK